MPKIGFHSKYQQLFGVLQQSHQRWVYIKEDVEKKALPDCDVNVWKRMNKKKIYGKNMGALL